MAQNKIIDTWRSRETRLAKARYEGATTLVKFSKKLRKYLDHSVEELQRQNNRFFSSITRNDSFGCTARRLV